MIRLLNSAVMPVEGIYRLQRITIAKFIHYLRNESFESYIGYPETAKIISEASGVKIPISREQTTVISGDILLIARLKYRMTNPSEKGKTNHTVMDFEFFLCEYSEG